VTITAYVGAQGAGKTTQLILKLRNAEKSGIQTHLFLCSDSDDLRARKHVKEGGLMGCRTTGLNYPITHFVSKDEAIKRLSTLQVGTMAVFDEAAWFGVDLVEQWILANNRGVEVVISSVSGEQEKLLENAGANMVKMDHPKCMLCSSEAELTRIKCKTPDGSNWLISCKECKSSIENNNRKGNAKNYKSIKDTLYRIDPFKKTKHAYQPLYNFPLKGWGYVREDCYQRADIMTNTLVEHLGMENIIPYFSGKKYLDLGCCTGFFCEQMSELGFKSSGIDINKEFISLAENYSELRSSNVNYLAHEIYKYVSENPVAEYDVTSSFATIQWIIQQNGLEAGLACFDWLFNVTKKMCVIEMGYTSEDIYKELPVNINKEWVINVMKERGNFDKVKYFPAKENGIWRDLFIGLYD